MLRFIGSVNGYHFYENTNFGTYAVYHNNKAVAYPATIEQLNKKMEDVGNRIKRYPHHNYNPDY